MNEFHFRVVDGHQNVKDIQQRLKGLEAARDHAVSMAVENVSNPNNTNFDGGAVIVEVYNLSKELMLNVRLVLDVERISDHMR